MVAHMSEKFQVHSINGLSTNYNWEKCWQTHGQTGRWTSPIHNLQMLLQSGQKILKFRFNTVKNPHLQPKFKKFITRCRRGWLATALVKINIITKQGYYSLISTKTLETVCLRVKLPLNWYWKFFNQLHTKLFSAHFEPWLLGSGESQMHTSPSPLCRSPSVDFPAASSSSSSAVSSSSVT